MASTRLNNSKGWYCQEQKAIKKSFKHEIYKYKCISSQSAFPCRLNMPMMVNGYNNNILSNNASDIESSLFGIGSTNLVASKKPVVPKINNIPSVKFFNEMKVLLPEPLIIEKCQRAAGPFC